MTTRRFLAVPQLHGSVCDSLKLCDSRNSDEASRLRGPLLHQEKFVHASTEIRLTEDADDDVSVVTDDKLSDMQAFLQYEMEYCAIGHLNNLILGEGCPHTVAVKEKLQASKQTHQERAKNLKKILVNKFGRTPSEINARCTNAGSFVPRVASAKGRLRVTFMEHTADAEVTSMCDSSENSSDEQMEAHTHVIPPPLPSAFYTNVPESNGSKPSMLSAILRTQHLQHEFAALDQQIFELCDEIESFHDADRELMEARFLLARKDRFHQRLVLNNHLDTSFPMIRKCEQLLRQRKHSVRTQEEDLHHQRRLIRDLWVQHVSDRDAHNDSLADTRERNLPWGWYPVTMLKFRHDRGFNLHRL